MKRKLVDYARDTPQLSLIVACVILGFGRSVDLYRSQQNKDLPVVELSQRVIEENPGLVLPKTFKTLRRRG